MPDVNFRVVARLKGHLLLRHPRKIQKCLVRQIGAEYLRGHPGQENCFFFGYCSNQRTMEGPVHRIVPFLGNVGFKGIPLTQGAAELPVVFGRELQQFFRNEGGTARLP